MGREVTKEEWKAGFSEADPPRYGGCLLLAAGLGLCAAAAALGAVVLAASLLG